MNLHEQNKPPPFPFLLNMFMHTYSTLLPDVQGQQPQTDQSGLHRNFTSPRAAPIACDAFNARAVAERKYHCLLHGSWQSR